MGIKEIFSVLSANEEAISYTSLLFETRAEKVSLLVFFGFFVSYLILLAFDIKEWALASALISILSLLSFSMASFINSKDFIFHPVRSYVDEFYNGIELEQEVLQKLSVFSKQALIEAKCILKYKRKRIKTNIYFLSGSIDKVGIFPSFLAFFYAFDKYQASSDASFLANIILGMVLGVYSGVLLFQRISSWQNKCIYLLSKAIDLKIDSSSN